MSEYAYRGRARELTPGMQEIVIEIPENEWITSNDRLHHMAAAKRTAALRLRAGTLARKNLHPIDGPAIVVCETYYRAGRGLDNDACAPTLKAIMDGFTDAGIWPDDAGRHVTETTYKRSVKHPELSPGWHALRILIIDQAVPF